MSEQEPVTLGELRILGMEALDQSNEGTSTGVCSKHRLCEPTAERILWVIFNGPCEETAVKIEYACGRVSRFTYAMP